MLSLIMAAHPTIPAAVLPYVGDGAALQTRLDRAGLCLLCAEPHVFGVNVHTEHGVDEAESTNICEECMHRLDAHLRGDAQT